MGRGNRSTHQRDARRTPPTGVAVLDDRHVVAPSARDGSDLHLPADALTGTTPMTDVYDERRDPERNRRESDRRFVEIEGKVRALEDFMLEVRITTHTTMRIVQLTLGASVVAATASILAIINAVR